jgi:hypothetical protein
MPVRSGVEFNIRSDLKGLQRDLRGLQKRQIPFAEALTVTGVARKVAEVETKAIESTFDRPTAFTTKALGVKAGTKARPTATVFVKDIQARYLEPFLNPEGGRQILGSKKTILMPIDVATNQFGNIPRGALKALKGRPGVFVGTVKTKEGPVAGVWQRPTRPQLVEKGRRGKRLANLAGHLVLLIRFTAPAEVGSAHNLRWLDRAQATIKAETPRQWAQAIAQALSTAR